MPSKSLSELRELVGSSVRTVEGLTVEAGKIAEFARAVGLQSEIFYDREAARRAGYDDVPAPPTFTRTAYFPRYRTTDDGASFGFDLGFDPEKTVHGEQSYEYVRSLTAGDTVYGTTKLAEIYQKSGSDGRILTFAVLETTYANEAGESVLVECRTRIERGGEES